MLYLRTADGRRLLLDTAKCELRFEESSYELSGATLDAYDFAWHVSHDGWYGEEKLPCTILSIRDPFTGITVEVPFLNGGHEQLGVALLNNGDKKRQRWLRRLL